MSRTLQFKRYANTYIASSVTGANGELIIDDTNFTITVHDGSTLGGKRLATETFVTNSLNSFSVSVNSEIILTQAAFNRANAANVLAQAAFNTSNIFTQSAYNQANAANVLAQTALTRANGSPNLFTGTSNFATAPLGTLYFGSNTGIQIVGSGSALYINDSQNLQTNGTPTFANVTSNNFYSNTGVDLFNFANAAFNQANTSSNVIAIAAFVEANVANLIANTAAANIATLFGIETTQNTWISSNAAFTQSAFNTANNASNGRTQNAESTNYILQLSDAGKYIYYTQSSNVILYIPTTSNVAFSNGTTIMIVSQNTAVSANITVSPNTGVSLYNAGNTISGSHNVTPYGVATLMMVKSNTWFISGFGVN